MDYSLGLAASMSGSPRPAVPISSGISTETRYLLVIPLVLSQMFRGLIERDMVTEPTPKGTRPQSTREIASLPTSRHLATKHSYWMDGPVLPC